MRDAVCAERDTTDRVAIAGRGRGAICAERVTADREGRKWEIGAIDCDDKEIGDRWGVDELVRAKSERDERRCARDGADCDQSRCRG